jgi:MFS family permease
MSTSPSTHDRRYEWQIVLLLSLGFGLVGLDRWIIAPLFPAMAKDLGLGYEALGLASGALGIAWGLCSTVFGPLADRRGRRVILLPALVVFSLMAGFTGAVNGLLFLLVLRTVMGAAEGAFLASSVAAVADASAPQRRGLNQGLQLSAFPLLGFGLGSVIATQLLTVLPSWRWVFVIVAVPGLLLAAILWRVLREPAHLAGAAPTAGTATPARAPVPWSTVLASRNVRLAMLSLVCAMSGIFVLGSMVPSYLVDHLGLPPAQMGLIMSALGVGGFIGDAAVGAASDRLGRKPVSIGCFVLAVASLVLFTRTGANPLQLYVTLTLVSLFCFGLLSIMTGPVATEAVPPALVASAIGLVSGAGEIIGGGLVPVAAGFVAGAHGIQNVFWVSFVGLGLGVLVSLFLVETAPRRTAPRAG